MSQTTTGITASAAPQDEILPIILNRQQSGELSPIAKIPPDVTVRGVFTADLTLMKMLRLQEQIDEVEELFRQELRFLEEWKKQRLAVLQNSYEFYADSVKAWLSIADKKSVQLPHGDIGFRKQPARVEILSEDKVLLQPEFVRVRRWRITGVGRV